ncbi:MAG TPA: hypothetical protein VJR92_01585 [Gemmatimonadaceae bacterium]|nr:hypothetical protein [Gemmatimonadaceae bacterium]
MRILSLRRTVFVAGALTLAALVARDAGAQGTQPVDPRTVPELMPVFERAAQLGVPTGPLVAKARKAYLTPQVSTKEIREVLQGMTSRLVTARDALAPVQDDAELDAGAEALRHEVTPAMLKKLRAAQRGRSIEVALGVLTQLVLQGVKPQDAATKVATWLSAGATDGRIMAAAESVAGDVAAGLAPSRALAVRSQGVLSLLPAPTQGTAAGQTNRQ